MLGENIQKLRRSKGLSQEELAIKLNVVRQTVSKWEKGLSVPDSEMLIKIADVFEVSVSKLLGETVEEKDTGSELAEISKKLENLNAMMAERNSRSRRIMMTAAAVALIIIAAIILIISYFAGWNNINAVNFGAFALMIVGLIVYIIGGKKDLAE